MFRFSNIVFSLFLSLAGIFMVSNGYAQSKLTVTPRIDSRTANFIWLVSGDNSFVEGYVVQCGPESDVYDVSTPILDNTTDHYPVLWLVSKNGYYYCIVGAVYNNTIVKESNEILIQLKGRWLYLYEWDKPIQ